MLVCCKKRSFYRKNQRGIALAEILVVLSIIVVIGAGIAQLIVNLTRTQQNLIDRFTHTETMSYLKILLQVQEKCTHMLRTRTFDINNLSSTSIALNEVTEGAATPEVAVFKTSTSTYTTGLLVDNINVNSFSALGIPDRYAAKLEITRHHKEGTIAQKPMFIGLKITNNPGTNIILSCVADGGSEAIGSTNNGVRIFTESGQFTVPEDVTSINVEVWGAGGGGAAGSASYNYNNSMASYTSGSAGGSGGYTMSRLTVTPGQIFTVTVGVGGSGAPAVSGKPPPLRIGSSGGTTSFGPLSATGGAGGRTWASTCASGACNGLAYNCASGGSGGSGTGGTVNRAGAIGGGCGGFGGVGVGGYGIGGAGRGNAGYHGDGWTSTSIFGGDGSNGRVMISW